MRNFKVCLVSRSNSSVYANYDDYSSPAYPSAYNSFSDRGLGYSDTRYQDYNAPAYQPHLNERTEYGGFSFIRTGRQFSSSVPYSMKNFNLEKSLDFSSDKPKNESQVLMIYGINQENFNCDKIFNLLCGFGNCEKVCFFSLKKFFNFLVNLFSIKFSIKVLRSDLSKKN